MTKKRNSKGNFVLVDSKIDHRLQSFKMHVTGIDKNKIKTHKYKKNFPAINIASQGNGKRMG